LIKRNKYSKEGICNCKGIIKMEGLFLVNFVGGETQTKASAKRGTVPAAAGGDHQPRACAGEAGGVA
jgi:hypothetical protein